MRNQLLNQFKTYLEGLNLSKKSLENYLSDVKPLLSRNLPLTPGNIREYTGQLRESNLPSSTINRHLSSLRHFNKFLINTPGVGLDSPGVERLRSLEIKNVPKGKLHPRGGIGGPFSPISLISLIALITLTGATLTPNLNSRVLSLFTSQAQNTPGVGLDSPGVDFSGDVQGPLDQTRVVALQGSPLGSTTPNLGALLIGNGKEWVSRTIGGAIRFTPGEFEVELTDNAVTSQNILDNSITTSDLTPHLLWNDGDLIDLSGVHISSNSEGIKLPQNTSCADSTGEGFVCWDTDNNTLVLGTGTGTITYSAFDKNIDSSDITDRTVAGIDVSGDALDFTEFEDTLDLDAGTEINFSIYNLTLDLDSTGDFVIQDAGTAFVTFSDTGATTFANDIAVNGGDITTTATTWNLDVGNTGSILFRDGTNTLLTIADGGSVGNVTVSGTLTSSGAFTASSTSTLAGDITFSSATPNIAINNTESLTITDGTNTLFTLADAGTTGNLTIGGDIAVNGGDITSTATTWNLDVGNTGSVLFRDGTNTLLTIADGGTVGNVTVSGTTTSSGVFTASSTSTLAGDITFSSATPNIAINNTESLTITDGTNTLFTLADAGTTGNLTISGDIAVNGGDVTTTATTWNLDVGNTGSVLFRDGTNTLLTIADGGTVGNVTVSGTTTSSGAFTASSTSTLAGDITFSSATPNIAINNTESLTITDGTNTLLTLADAGTTGNLTISGDIAVNGGDITTTATTWNLDVGNTGSIVFRDGTNTLASIVDQGAFGTIRLTDKASTGDPSTCTIGDTYFNLTDATVKTCTATNTWEALDGAASGVWSDITAPTAATSTAHAGNTTTFTFNSVTTGTAFTLSSTSVTTGSILALSDTLATGSTGALLSLAHSGTGPTFSYTTTPIAAGATGTYSTLTYLPGARITAASLVYNGYLFAVGGSTGSEQSTVYSAQMRADGTIGTFSTLTYLPQARSAPATAYNGYLFVISGTDGSNRQSTVYSASISSTGTLGTFTTLTYFPQAINQVSAASYNGYLFIVGGFNGSATQSTVYSAPINSNGTIGAFSTLTYLPQVLRRHSISVNNGYLFVIGGTTGSVQSTVYSAAINADGTIGVFSTLTYLPQALQEAQPAVYNGYLYVVGGLNTATQSTVYSALIASNGTIGAFSTLTYLPVGRDNFSTASSNGYLYVVGGSPNNTTTPQSTVYSSPLRTTALALNTTSDFAQGLLLDLRENNESKFTIGYNGDITTQGSYISSVVPSGDGSTGAYSTLTYLPQALLDHSSETYNGYLYVVGGGSTIQSTVYSAPVRSDGTIGTFSTLTYLPAVRANHSSAAYNGYLFVSGGTTGSIQSTVWSTPIRSDGTLGSFSTLTYIPQAIRFHSSVAYNGYLFITGGRTGAPATQSTVYSAQILTDGTLGAFSTLTYLPGLRYGHAAAAYNGYLFVVGGIDASNNQSTIYSAPILSNGTLGAFSTLTYLPQALYTPTASSYNGYLYVSGGQVVGNQSTVYSAPIRADGTLGAFSTLTYLPIGIREHAASIYNGYLLVSGGTTGSVQSTVYSASLTTSRAFVFNANSQTWPEGTGLGGSASLWSLQNNGDAVANISAQGDLMIRGKLSANSVVIGTDKPGDLAENMETADPSIEAGDVVSVGKLDVDEEKLDDGSLKLDEEVGSSTLDPNSNIQPLSPSSNNQHPTSSGLVKSSRPYDSKLIGVISTNPSITLSPHLANSRPVVLSGRAPVKVSLENGPIEPGDYLTSSSTPGVGMKATKAGAVIGKALEGYGSRNTPGEYGRILSLISPSFFIGDIDNLASTNLASNSSFQSQPSTLNSLLVLGHSTLGPTVFTDGINIGGISIDPGGKNTSKVGLDSFEVEGPSISSLTTLNLQPEFLGCPQNTPGVGLLALSEVEGDSPEVDCLAISFLSGALEIDSDGNLSLTKGHLSGNSSWRDVVTLPAGQTEVKVNSKEWRERPKTVNVSLGTSSTQNTPGVGSDSPGVGVFSSFATTDIDTTGFTIKVDNPTDHDRRLYWIAIW